MKELSAIFIFFIYAFTAEAQSPSKLREKYYSAVNSNEQSVAFYNLMKSETDSSPLVTGYKGMAAFLRCNHISNPYTRIKYFNEGKSCLDKAIVSSADNVELRFLRYSVQKNVPAFLGYSSNLEEDKKFLRERISSPEFKKTDEDLYNRIVNFLSLENN